MSTKTMETSFAWMHWNDLLAQVRRGTEIVLLQDKRPVARVVPIETEQEPRVAGLHQGSLRMREDFDEPLPDEFWTGER